MRTGSIVVLALLCACTAYRADTSAQAVGLSVEPEVVSAGDPVVLVLANGLSSAIGYNLCGSELERRGDGGWDAVPSDRVCTLELRTLAPGERDRYRLELPEDLAPGEYRFQTTVHEWDTEAARVVSSGPFQVGS